MPVKKYCASLDRIFETERLCSFSKIEKTVNYPFVFYPLDQQHERRSDRMLRQSEIWEIMQEYIPRNQWISLSDIYDIVQRHAELDKEDHLPQSPSSNVPKWKRNVRNIIQSKKYTDELDWDQKAHYLLP